MATDRTLLMKGIRRMALCVLFMFMGPGLFYEALKNKEHALFVPVLMLGILFSALAIGIGFNGIAIIMRSIFSDKK